MRLRTESKSISTTPYPSTCPLQPKMAFPILKRMKKCFRFVEVQQQSMYPLHGLGITEMQVNGSFSLDLTAYRLLMTHMWERVEMPSNFYQESLN